MKEYPVIEFNTIIENDGIVRLPEGLQKKLIPGSAITIRIVEGGLPKSLRTRGVNEDEIETIARLQLEQRKNVLRFLSTEGLLSRNRGFNRRVKTLIG